MKQMRFIQGEVRLTSAAMKRICFIQGGVPRHLGPNETHVFGRGHAPLAFSTPGSRRVSEVTARRPG